MSGFIVKKNIRYGEYNDNFLDIYEPDGDILAYLVFFHGGGLSESSKDDFEELGKAIAGKGIAVAFPNYRMYPNCGYPDFIVDAKNAILFIQNYYGEKGIFVSGHSAGAYLCGIACFDKNYMIDLSQLKGIMLFSGQPTVHFNILRQRGMDERKVVIDEAALLYHIDKNGPPLLITCAEDEIENRTEQNQLLVSTLRYFRYKSDVEFQILMAHNHSSYVETKDENGDFLVARLIRNFIEKYGR